MPDEDTFVFSEKHALYFPFCCEQLDQDKVVYASCLQPLPTLHSQTLIKSLAITPTHQWAIPE